MFFNRSDIDHLPSYGEVVDAGVIIEKVTDLIKRKLAFEPDYYDGERVRLDVAEEFLMEMYSVVKSMGR